MTNVIINKEELLSEEQLDQVAGSTCQETDQIINALGKVTVYYKNTKGGGKHAVVGKLLRSEVEDYLKDHFGIEASTHNGFLFFSDGARNTYKRNGQSLTHQQVMEIIIPEGRRAIAE